MLMNNPKSILLTGSTGFVGKHLYQFLIQNGHKVYCWKRNDINFFNDVEVIINCAAELINDRDMFESNVSLTQKLLFLSSHTSEFKNPNCKFIQIGSSSEYGATNKIRHEDMFCIPTNIYEATKLAATNLCIGYANRYDFDCCVARPFSLYGPGDTPRKFIPKIYDAIINDYELKVYKGSHDWIYIDDFIEGIYKLINAPKKITKGQIYNFGSGRGIENQFLIQEFEDTIHLPCCFSDYLDYKYNKYDVDNWQADISKAKRLLDWEPKIELKEGLKRYIISRENNK